MGVFGRTVKASEGEWHEWQVRANEAGVSRNHWIRQACNDAAELERTLKKQAKLELFPLK